MAGKTNTDLIRDLGNVVAGHEVRLADIGKDTVRIEAVHAKTAETLSQVVTRVTVLEEKFAELKKGLEESDRKRWMLTLTVIGTFRALLANLDVTLLRK